MSATSQWVEWNGGACPVPPETLLEIRCTDGKTGLVTAETCSQFPDWWSDKDGARFITAYRLLELDTEARGDGEGHESS